MENIPFWEIFTNYLNSNQGLIVSINLLATIFIFGGILILTRKYTKSTQELAKETSKYVKKAEESIEITKEKERIDRILDYADKFDYKKLMDLNRLKTKEKDKDIRSFSKGLSNLYYLIRYFDKLAILYFNGKINEEIFEGHIEPILVNFAYWFRNEICNELKELKAGKGYYWYINFAKLADKVLMKSKYQDGRHLIIALYVLTREYKKIIGEDK